MKRLTFNIYEDLTMWMGFRTSGNYLLIIFDKHLCGMSPVSRLFGQGQRSKGRFSKSTDRTIWVFPLLMSLSLSLSTMPPAGHPLLTSSRAWARLLSEPQITMLGKC